MFTGRNKLIISSLILILLLFIFGSIIFFNSFYSYSSDRGFDITVNNRTGYEINGLVITFESAITDNEVPSIKPYQSYKFNITPKEDFTENSMSILYKDKAGKEHKEMIIGYFEKSYANAIVSIDIISINENGEIIFEIKSSL